MDDRQGILLHPSLGREHAFSLDMKLPLLQTSPRRCRGQKHRADRVPETQRAYEGFHALHAHESDFQIRSYSRSPVIRLHLSLQSAKHPLPRSAPLGLCSLCVDARGSGLQVCLIRVISISIHARDRLLSERTFSSGHVAKKQYRPPEYHSSILSVYASARAECGRCPPTVSSFRPACFALQNESILRRCFGGIPGLTQSRSAS